MTIKSGDTVTFKHRGNTRRGTVVDISHVDQNGEFWFEVVSERIEPWETPADRVFIVNAGEAKAVHHD